LLYFTIKVCGSASQYEKDTINILGFVFQNSPRIFLDQFYQDPYINTAEVESLTSQIVTALQEIKDVFIILTSRLTDNLEFPALSRIEIRAKKVFDETKLNLSVYNKGRLKKVSMTGTELTN
jgi:hypothetical protein